MAIRSGVTVSLVPEARGGPFVFHGDLPDACQQAQALGFDAVEVFPPSAEAPELNDLQALLSDHGLALAAIGTGAGWLREKLHLCLPDPASRNRARDFILSLIDAAGPLGAPVIIGSMQGRSDDRVDPPTARGYLADALEELGEYAASYKVPLVFEPLNRYETNLVNTLADGAALLGSLSTRNVVLLADLFHMNIEEKDIAGALAAAGRRVGHVHFVDSNRRPAGSGHIDFAPVAAALRAIDYDGFVSAEALPYPDPTAAARATIDAFRLVFGPDGPS
jgi:sugar phosphate isomerase/epimerase